MEGAQAYLAGGVVKRFPGRERLSRIDALQALYQGALNYRLRRRFARLTRDPAVEMLAFVCNLCGQSVVAPTAVVRQRESSSCYHCGATQRLRWLVHVLSVKLFGRSLPLPEFPASDHRGVGLSDAFILASRLKRRMDYSNTFYHRGPRLDISAPWSDSQPTWDFVISSDVLEHVAPPLSRAIENTFKLLNPAGVLVLTVPFSAALQETVEHFPNLYDYRLVKSGGQHTLINRTREGKEERFEELVFHGGQGATLEMRQFSEAGLVRELTRAGFTKIQFYREDVPEYGIVQQPDNSPVLSAERPK